MPLPTQKPRMRGLAWCRPGSSGSELTYRTGSPSTSVRCRMTGAKWCQSCRLSDRKTMRRSLRGMRLKAR